MLGTRPLVNHGRRMSLAIVLVFLLPATAHPQSIHSPPRLPEYVFEDNLTDAERGSLREAEPKVRKSVFFVGHPGGSNGTAFLVSRERRLLATAAHIADIDAELGSLIAIPDGSTASYRVQRVYYHPNLMRVLDEGLHVRSDRVTDGKISLRGPDVALLELAPGGPELPDECTFASDAELRDGCLSAVISLGHSASHANAWPPGVRQVTAASGSGRIRSMTGFPPREREPVPFESRRRVTYDDSLSEGGFSGGPVCLPNGHVIALVSHIIPSDGASEPIGVGERIDCVRDMLVRLQTPLKLPSAGNVFDLGAPANPQSSRISHRFQVEDSRLPQLRQAVAELKQTTSLSHTEKYAQSVAICNRLIVRLPHYGHAYEERAFAYRMYSYEFPARSVQWRQYMNWALADYRRAVEIDPDFVDCKVDALNCRMYMAREDEIISVVRSLIAESTVEIEKPGQPSWIRARFLAFRAVCRKTLNDLAGAKVDIDESIRLAPDWSTYWDDRADILDSLKDPAAAEESRRIAEELRKPDPEDEP